MEAGSDLALPCQTPGDAGSSGSDGMRNSDSEPEEVGAIEDTLLLLARDLGERIEGALPELRTVHYKSNDRSPAPTDPVSEVDRALERYVRAEISSRFPDHSIIGEEYELEERGDRYVWVIDPVDGTTNFVNGFPMFAGSIGVLEHGRPLAGAIWTSTSHTLRPGVYHAGTDRELRFDGAPLRRRPVDRSNQRVLVGNPKGAARPPGWDSRVTGSAALECALVAAGILHASALIRPNLWDVAAGVALVLAANEQVLLRPNGAQQWVTLDEFGDADARPSSLASWCGDLLIGPQEVLQRWIDSGLQ